jgi:hypothetical protein
MLGSRRITLFLILLVTLALVSPGPGAGQEPAETFNIFLPLVRTAPSAIYGRVTDCGIATPGVSLELRFYDGSAWSTRMTTVTDSAGNYRFQNAPALAAGQKYLVRYHNVIDQSRLGIWETPQLTSFPIGNGVDMGSFDIANVALNSPIYGYETNLPHLFSWTPRQHTPSDSYKFNLFDIYGESYTPKFSTSPLGQTDSYRLTGLPPGFNYCNPYFWAITVNSPDGGWGGSLWAYQVTFYAQPSYSGIYGCVTDGGMPASGVSVMLLRWNSMTEEKTWMSTESTLNGVFSFTGVPGTQANDYYYVQYTNIANPNRVAVYETKLLADYEAGSLEHIGDFDIANIELGAPDGILASPPYVFQWTPRPATATDDYELHLFGEGDDPYTYWDSLGYTDNFALQVLPWNFDVGVPYQWNVWIYDPFGGNGISYEKHGVMFSSEGMRLDPIEPMPDLLDRLRQRRLESSTPSQPPPPAREHPDYELLIGER